MVVRSVSTRYSASVGQLVSELGRAAKANERLADSADKAGKQQDKTVDRMAKGGAVIALGLGVAIAKFAEFDAAMSQAQAASGTTGAELNALRDAAVKAGKDTQYSATQAAQGITELSKAGVGAADILGGGLKGALNLAAAGQIEVADAAEIAATAMTQFKLRGDQVNHVADLLAAGANKAQGGVGDLGMALKQSGLVASQTGLSVEETTAALTSFASAGLIGSDAGTSLKTMLQRLTPQSDEAAALMEQLGISAYDAQGNFIGLEKFAGNLRESMQDLTPQQRAAANSVIFGSDAVRAANVLYNEGATGIRKWTDEVNQQGYAAKQAAVLTNNLQGDIERLGGSFETNLIQTGSGANDTLRSLVQTGDALLEVIGAIPGPILTGAAAFTALALVGPKVGNLAKTVTGPLNSGLDTFRNRAALAQASAVGYGVEVEGAGRKSLTAGQRISSLGKGMGGLKGAAGGLMGVLGGPWGVALTAATAGITIWAQKQADARAAGDALKATIDEQTGAFTKNSKETVLSAFADALSPEDLARVQEMGVNLNEVTAALLQGGPAAVDAKNKLKALSDERAGLFGSSDSRILEGLMNEFDLQAEGADKARASMELLRQAKNQQLAADSNLAGSASAAEQGITGVATAAEDADNALDGAVSTTESMNRTLSAMGARSDDAKASIDALTGAVDLLGGGTRALRAAQRGVKESLDNLVEAQNAKTSKTKSAKEVEADYQAALDDVGASMDDLLKRQIDQQAPAKALTETYNNQRKAVVESLKTHGLHGKELQAEADKIVGTKRDFALLLAEYKKNPAQVATTVKANGTGKAKQDVKGVWEVINGVPRFVPIYVSVTSNVNAAVANIQSTIGQIGASIFQPKKKAATGGAIFGAGTATSDSIPALLSNGEHVLTADDVQDAGGHAAIYRMRKAIQSGELRFADGGAVGAYVPQRFATGGAAAPLDQFYSDYVSRLGERVTAADLVANRKAIATATERLRIAEMKLNEDRRKKKSARTIAQDELAVARARDAVTSATRRATSETARYRAQQTSPLTKFSRGLSSGVKNTGTFIANIQKIASRGFVTLAQQLAAMSNEDAEKIAAQAATASTGTLQGLSRGVTTAQTQQAKLEHIDTITAILGQVRSRNLTARQMAAATGIDVMEVLDAAALIRGDLAKNKNASKLLADLAKRSRGQLFATGGAVFGAGTETSDSIPAWLSTNEHVWAAREVRGAGGHAAVMRLRKAAAAGALPRFANGGPVGVSVAGGAGMDMRMLAALIRQGGGDTFHAYGIGDDAIQAAIRQKEFREMSRL